MARLLYQAFEKDRPVTKGIPGLAPGSGQLLKKVARGMHFTHTLAPAASRGFNQQRESGALCFLK